MHYVTTRFVGWSAFLACAKRRLNMPRSYRHEFTTQCSAFSETNFDRNLPCSYHCSSYDNIFWGQICMPTFTFYLRIRDWLTSPTNHRDFVDRFDLSEKTFHLWKSAHFTCTLIEGSLCRPRYMGLTKQGSAWEAPKHAKQEHARSANGSLENARVKHAKQECSK